MTEESIKLRETKLSESFVKCEYFNDTFDANKNNSKSMWKTIKSLTGGKKNAKSFSCFKDGDCITDDKKGMSDLFNRHFASMTGSLRSTLPSVNWNFDNLHNFVNSRKHPDVLLPVPTVTPSIVNTIFLRISPDQAVGIHCIRLQLLRIAAPEIVPSVVRLIIFFIKNGVFLK